MAEVKNLVQQWRDGKEQIRLADEAREKLRKQLHEQDEIHVQAVQKFDSDKSHLLKLISESKKELAAEHQKTQEAIREADTLMNEAHTKQSRNRNHREFLEKALHDAQVKRNRIIEQESEPANNLQNFRIQRSRHTSQLHQAIQTLKDTLPKEREATAREIAAASEAKEAARKQLEVDKKQWAQTVAARKRVQHANMVEAVEEEQEAASEGKQEAKQFKTRLQQSLVSDEQMLGQIRQLKASLGLLIHPNSSMMVDAAQQVA